MPGNSRDQAAPVTTGGLPVRSAPATQAEIDAAQAKADAISKAVGTTVDLVYPQIKGGHEGALVPDYNAAPIGFRFDNGQSQYVNIDLNGQVTGVQQRGGGLAAVLPFIEKAVEFVLPATIPFIEGANALYAASQGNIAGALAGAANMGVQIPGVDTSSFKSVTNYINGADALSKGNIGGVINAVSNATSDPALKADLKTAATELGIAQSVFNGNPMAALRSVVGSAGNSRAINSAASDYDWEAAESALGHLNAADFANVNPTEAELKLQYAAANRMQYDNLTKQFQQVTDLGVADPNSQEYLDAVAQYNRDLSAYNANNPSGAAATTSDTAALNTEPSSALNALGTAQVAALTTGDISSLSPVDVTGTADSGLPVTRSIDNSSNPSNLSQVLVTGQKAALTSADLPSVDVLATSNLAPLTSEQIGALTQVLVTGQKAALDTSDIDLLTTSDLKALNTSAITALSSVQISALHSCDVGYEWDPILKACVLIPSLTTSDLTSLTTSQIPLSTSQVKPLTTPQVSVIPPVVVPKVTSPIETLAPTPKFTDQSPLPGKVLTLGKMGNSMRYDEGLKQLDMPNMQRWMDSQDPTLQNADVSKAMAALAQFAPDAEKDVIPQFYADGGMVSHFAGGGETDATTQKLQDDNISNFAKSMASLGNLPTGLDIPKPKLLQVSGPTNTAPQKPLQQMTVIPQLAALLQARGMKLAEGGRADHEHPEYDGIPVFRTGGLEGLGGKYVEGKGDGTSDDITAMLANGEYVFSADVVAALGNGSNKSGAEQLDQMVRAIRSRARSAPPDKLPPDAKSPLEYLKSSKGKKHG